MDEQRKFFQVGDQVIHCTHGPGVIKQLEEKHLAGSTQTYYEVQMRDLMLWVPVEPSSKCSLRLPTPEKEFNNLFQILASPGIPLSPDRNERRIQLVERFKDHEIASICEVIRDLSWYKDSSKMTIEDKNTLEHTRNLLIDEWSLVFSIPPRQAEKELSKLLESKKNVSEKNSKTNPIHSPQA
jgi:RNA polymerase-interacting CarD/CdnL/TRCF family regulator